MVATSKRDAADVLFGQSADFSQPISVSRFQSFGRGKPVANRLQAGTQQIADVANAQPRQVAYLSVAQPRVNFQADHLLLPDRKL